MSLQIAKLARDLKLKFEFGSEAVAVSLPRPQPPQEAKPQVTRNAPLTDMRAELFGGTGGGRPEKKRVVETEEEEEEFGRMLEPAVGDEGGASVEDSKVPVRTELEPPVGMELEPPVEPKGEMKSELSDDFQKTDVELGGGEGGEEEQEDSNPFGGMLQ